VDPDRGRPLDRALLRRAPGVEGQGVWLPQALVAVGAGGHGVEEEGRADLGLHGDVALGAVGAQPLRLQADVRPVLVRGGWEGRLAAVWRVCMHAEAAALPGSMHAAAPVCREWGLSGGCRGPQAAAANRRRNKGCTNAATRSRRSAVPTNFTGPQQSEPWSALWTNREHGRTGEVDEHGRHAAVRVHVLLVSLAWRVPQNL